MCVPCDRKNQDVWLIGLSNSITGFADLSGANKKSWKLFDFVVLKMFFFFKKIFSPEKNC